MPIPTRIRAAWQRSRPLRRTTTDQHGVTLVQVLVATALLAIGIVAVLSAMSAGLDGVETSLQPLR